MHNSYLLNNAAGERLGGAKESFKAIYADLQNINPDEVTGRLYSAGLLVKSDKDDINDLHVRTTKVNKLLDAVEKAISIKPDNFFTFLNILDSIPLYKPIVEKARTMLS